MFHTQKIVEDDSIKVAIFYNTQILCTVTAKVEAMGNLDLRWFDPDNLEHARMTDYIEDVL